MNPFLPDNYEAPRGASSYMRLQDGENKFRILSQPILGWEDWDDKRPIRFRFDQKPVKPLDIKRPIRHFWSMIVWNYAEDLIQILSITQSTVQKQIQALCNDSDWGQPYFYDMKIVKSGEGKETKYQVNPVPHKPVSQNVVKAFNDRPINLEALFENEDPFTAHTRKTAGIFTKDAVTDLPKSADENVCDEQFTESLYSSLKECSLDYQETIKSFCSKYGIKENLSNLPIALGDKLAKGIEKNRQEQFLEAMGE